MDKSRVPVQTVARAMARRVATDRYVGADEKLIAIQVERHWKLHLATAEAAVEAVEAFRLANAAIPAPGEASDGQEPA